MSVRLLWLITFVLTVICWAILVLAYVSVSSRVHSTQGDINSAYDLFGIPLVEGFRVAGRLGLKFEWGSAVLAIGPFVLALIASLVQIARYTTRRSAATVDQET